MSQPLTEKAVDWAEIINNLATEDDEPVDNLFSAKQQTLLKRPLSSSWTPPPTPSLMAKLDRIHNAVKNALLKDGWTITHDPYTIVYEDVTLFADLGAERSLAAERGGEKIAVEIKSFLSPSPVHDFEIALGQYLFYLGFIELTDPGRRLYLAVSQDVYQKSFARKSFQLSIQRHQLRLIAVNLKTEEITLWIK